MPCGSGQLADSLRRFKAIQPVNLATAPAIDAHLLEQRAIRERLNPPVEEFTPLERQRHLRRLQGYVGLRPVP